MNSISKYLWVKYSVLGTVLNNVQPGFYFIVVHQASEISADVYVHFKDKDIEAPKLK